MIHTSVARILSPTHVILSAGSEQGVQVGMVFAIYQLSEPILDPETHESLGRLEIIKGRVKVSDVQEKLCHAWTFSHRKTHPLSPFRPLLGDLFQDYEEPVFEQLKVDSAVAVQTDLTVRVGDLVRSIE